MQKNYMNLLVLAFFFLTAFILAQEYFPSEIGNKWEFEYHSRTGHSGGGTDFYGIVTWEIVSVEYMDEIIDISISEQKEMTRKTYSNFTGESFDSIFDPPRVVSIDTFQLIDSGNVLYSDNGQILIHNPEGTIPEGICVIDTFIEISGKNENVILATVGDCNLSEYYEYDFFMQMEGFGPVSYSYDSWGGRQMEGGHIYEDWILSNGSTSIAEYNNQEIFLKSNQLPGIIIRENANGGICFIFNEADERINQSGSEIVIYNVNGRLLYSKMDIKSLFFIWDGTGNAGRKLAPGTYIIRSNVYGNTCFRKAILKQ